MNFIQEFDSIRIWISGLVIRQYVEQRYGLHDRMNGNKSSKMLILLTEFTVT